MLHRGRIEFRYWNTLHSTIEALQMFVVLLVLQVCGVASIWGYSEILGWRSGYDEDWATVVIVFMSLSGFRLIASNLKPAHKWKCVTSMMDPSSSLRSNESSIFSRLMKYVGVGYSFLLDFVLQILGTASIWAYSEIAGYRKTAESKKWANVTIFFSFLSLVRYVVKFRRSYHDRDLSSHFKDSMSYWEYFEVGFVGSLSSRKKVMRSIKNTWNYYHPSTLYTLHHPLVSHPPPVAHHPHPPPPPPHHHHPPPPPPSSHTYYHEPHVYHHHLYPQPPPHHHFYCYLLYLYLSTFSFLFGFGCHFALAIVLEGLGSGGAIWGISEVLTLRTTSHSLLFRILATCVSFAVSLKLLLHFYDKYKKITLTHEPAPSRVPNPTSPDEIPHHDHEEAHILGDHYDPHTHDAKSDESIMNPILNLS